MLALKQPHKLSFVIIRLVCLPYTTISHTSSLIALQSQKKSCIRYLIIGVLASPMFDSMYFYTVTSVVVSKCGMYDRYYYSVGLTKGNIN